MILHLVTIYAANSMFLSYLGVRQAVNSSTRQMSREESHSYTETFDSHKCLLQNGCRNWGKWAVGAYVYARLPVQSPEDASGNRHIWQNYPVLILDILREEGEIQFVIAHLYSRDKAAQCLQKLPRFARWGASISFSAWPRECTYVFSNHVETVYEWDLRTWSRSVSPSVATHLLFDIRTSRLAVCDSSPRTAIGRALSMNPGFRYFFILPREVRDIIYNYTLFDERQMTSHSRIYTQNILSRQRCREKGLQWYCNPSLPTLGPFPTLHTPSILRVCKQVRCEALETLYRTKTLVITVTSSKDRLCDLSQSWLPSLSRCSRVRVDFAMASNSVSAELSKCFYLIANLLLHQARSLQFLEVRIGYLLVNVPAATHNGEVLEMSPDDIAGCMFSLVPLVEKQGSRIERGYKPVQIIWGYLKQVWSHVLGEAKGNHLDVDHLLRLEDCRRLGCRFHCHHGVETWDASNSAS
jgi:hypothetical protein